MMASHQSSNWLKRPPFWLRLLVLLVVMAVGYYFWSDNKTPAVIGDIVILATFLAGEILHRIRRPGR